MIPRIALISPYNHIASYGIRSLATNLRTNGFTVSVFHLINHFRSNYKQKVVDELVHYCRGYDLIGISCISNYLPNCLQLSQAIRAQIKVPVIWGGSHPTAVPEECLGFCDFVVRGEGEKPLVEIANAIASGQGYESTKGLLYESGGKVYVNELNTPLEVHEFPVLDNDYTTDYVLWGNKIHPMNARLLKKSMTSDYMTVTSFGCPFNCSYCINNILHKMYNYKVRIRQVDHVMSELTTALKQMPFIRYISFEDDAFIIRNVDEMREFTKAYKSHINLPFYVSGMNPAFVTEEKFRMLIDAGMDRVRMGIESASDHSLELYNRMSSKKKLLEATRIINRYKRRLKIPSYDIITDNPFETQEDILMTIDVLKDIPAPFTLNIFSLTLYPGTALYERALAEGLITDPVKQIYHKNFLHVSNTYLNFIFVLYALFKIPSWMRKILINKNTTTNAIRIPQLVFHFFHYLGYARRAIDWLRHGDPHSVMKHLLVKMYR